MREPAAHAAPPHTRIRHHIVVMSGKGGVGKSTVAVHLAAALHKAGWRTGLLDVDIHGPSIPTMLGLERAGVTRVHDVLQPVAAHGLKVMSTGFMVRDMDQAVIWRGPLKMKLIREFLANVAWGALDVLVIDVPPGTGDEPLSVCQVLGAVSGALLVTTPQKVAAADVRKSITFCRALNVPILGVVENMSGFVCPACGTHSVLFPAGAAEAMARELQVPFLGAIPFEPRIAQQCDNGTTGVGADDTSAVTATWRTIVQSVLALDGPVPASLKPKEY